MLAPAVLKGKPFVAGTDEIGVGTTICYVQDDALAAALISVNIPTRKDPAVMSVLYDGKHQYSYAFYPHSEDGLVSTKECIIAWANDLQWIKDNPEHRFAYAMAAVKNLAKLKEIKSQHTPAIAMRMDGSKATLLVKPGGPKHKAAIVKGYKQI